MIQAFVKTFLLAILVICLSTCAAVRGAELATARLIFSPSQEAQLGAAFAEQIEAETPIIDDPEINAWIDSIGQKLVATSPATPLNFTFRVTALRDVNAFAIPGGFCYINAGLIAIAANEAEVAAVVGHEINHVTRRHGIRSLQRQIGLDLMVQLASMDPGAATAAAIIRQSGGVLATRKFGRQDELEADFFGVQAMYGVGYDPRMAISFFEKLRAGEQMAGRQGGVFAQLLATHPTTQDRIDRITAQVEAKDLTRDFRTEFHDFARIQARVRELSE